jgi:hypothetical protein
MVYRKSGRADTLVQKPKFDSNSINEALEKKILLAGIVVSPQNDKHPKTKEDAQ